MEKEADPRTDLLRLHAAVLAAHDFVDLLPILAVGSHRRGEAAVGQLGARRGASSPDPARRVARDLVTDRAPRFRYTILARPLPSASSHRPPPPIAGCPTTTGYGPARTYMQQAGQHSVTT